MRNLYLVFFFLLAICFQTYSQHVASCFSDASDLGISTEHIDSIYNSAINVVDTSEGVFKTKEEKDALYNAYVKLLQDFGGFLSEHDFKWEEPKRCIHKIYFNADGTIGYFLYGFKGENKLPEAREKEFERLLNLFIQDYKISVTANQKFSQCGSAIYHSKDSSKDNQE